MNIYLIERTDDWDYDEYDSLVVVAKSEDEAKQIMPSKLTTFDSKWSDWTNSVENVKATLVGFTETEKEGTVICASFNAG